MRHEEEMNSMEPLRRPPNGTHPQKMRPHFKEPLTALTRKYGGTPRRIH